jgi:hypothetical protein
MKNDVADTGSTAVRERAADKFGARQSDAEKQELQKKMEAAATPGPAHKALDALAGSWKAEVRCWMDPDGPPNLSHGTAKATWTLNGRFLEEEFRGEMMGKPFIGRTLIGHDTFKQTFNSVWISDMQTSMFTSEGKSGDNPKVITLEGKSSCPATGLKDIPMKSVYRQLTPDKRVFEMYDGSKGADVKTMEITYIRQ